MQGKRKKNPRNRKKEDLTKPKKTPGSIDKRAQARKEKKKWEEAHAQRMKEIDPSGLVHTGQRVTRSKTRDSRELAKELEIAKEQKAREQLEKQRAQSLANRPQAPAGNRSDRQLHMAFIQMGQGDCTIISTPGGTSI